MPEQPSYSQPPQEPEKPKKQKKNHTTLKLVALVLAFFVGLSPVILIVCAGVVGYVARRLVKLSGGGAEK